MRYHPLQRTDDGYVLGKHHVDAGSRLEVPNNPFGQDRIGIVIERDGALCIDFAGKVKALDELLDESFGYAGKVPQGRPPARFNAPRRKN